MKFLLGLSCLVLLLAATTASPVAGPRKGNAIDNLIRAALEYVRKMLKDNEPMKVPNIPRQIINDDDTKIYLTADLTDVYVSKASEFTVDHIENNVLQLWAKFGVTVPTTHLEGKYRINGTFVGRDVEGTGPFSGDVSNLVTNGFVQLEFIDHTLHMKDLQINYTIQDFKFKEQGLVVEGMTEEQLEELFNKSLLQYFQSNEPFVSSRIARQVMIEANEIINGKTVQDVIEWLENFLHPTASPALK